MSEIIDLPIVVNGVVVTAGTDRPTITLDYETGVAVRLPALLPSDLSAIADAAPQIDRALSEVTTEEIIEFLARIGTSWQSGGLKAREMMAREAHRLIEYPWVVLNDDYRFFAQYLKTRDDLRDQLASEFGSSTILDEWLPVQMCWRRAFPAGMVVHWLAGNIPLASLYSIMRSMVSKNRTVAKLPSRDPVSALGFALSAIELDPDHPVSRALTVAYWGHDDPVGIALMQQARSVQAWGGADAISGARRHAPPDVPFAAYGPKWSAGVVDLTRCDADEAAMRVVADIATYDQEACLSTQRLFVKGDLREFIARLQHHFELFAQTRPLVTNNRDVLAHRSATVLASVYDMQATVVGSDFAIIVEPDADSARVRQAHPLTRTAIIHPVTNFDGVADWFDRDSQAVGVFPYLLATEYRDAWATAGIDRIYEAGFSRWPRRGFTHDGVHGIHSMVRFATVDRPTSEPDWRDPDVPASYRLVERFDRYRND